ncbi:MAG: PAS domain-containing protein [Alphaproteobacteria bacterium]|nr:PAS domain-containing protein [Alphaproteobacteria bacterium]
MDVQHRFPVIGIGVKGGGPPALEGFLRHLPAIADTAFIIATRLPAGREGIVAEIFKRYTTMPVVLANHDAVLKPGHVYVGPPGYALTVKNGRLRLEPNDSDRHRFPIDHFLISLAKECGEAAIGIVLPNGGGDGELGLAAIKDHGGLPLAQELDDLCSTRDALADSATAAGAASRALSLEDMGARVAEFATNVAALQTVGDVDRTEAVTTTAPLEEISAILSAHAAYDLRGYKPHAVLRHVQHRMQAIQIETLDAYVGYLRRDEDEASLLFRDLLGSVTSFFRDPASFEALEKQVIPWMCADKRPDTQLRIWVPACATGQEAYSIAILLREYLDELEVVPGVQIFATDIDEEAIEIARIGRYQAEMLPNVSQARLNRFFTRDDAGHSVTKDIRDICVFSSVLQDLPFSQIDLISCRNLFMYLDAESQARALLLFHSALKPGGILLMENSESVARKSDLFTVLDEKNCIYQRRDNSVGSRLIDQGAPVTEGYSGVPGRRSESGVMLTNLRRAVETRVMDGFSPPHVVVNRDGDALYYSARTGNYLEAAPGLPNRQLGEVARKRLRLELRAALRGALESGGTVTREGIVIDIGDQSQTVHLVVEPFGDSASDPLLLVLFCDIAGSVAGNTARCQSHDVEMTVDQLASELRETREHLHLVVEQYETAIRELKSSNDEFGTINSELQSVDMQMEAARGELQFVQEELNAAISKLSDKVDELDKANSDLRNVFDSTGAAVIFLDRDGAIRSFSPAAAAHFKLISSDRARPLTDIASSLVDAGDILDNVRAALEQGSPVERRVGYTDDRTHQILRIMPYRNDEGAVEGALMIFLDAMDIGVNRTAPRARSE